MLITRERACKSLDGRNNPFKEAFLSRQRCHMESETESLAVNPVENPVESEL